MRLASVNVPTAAAVAAPRAIHATGKFHVVKSGETLFSIAQRYGTDVEALRSANRLGARAVIHPGLRLRLP